MSFNDTDSYHDEPDYVKNKVEDFEDDIPPSQKSSRLRKYVCLILLAIVVTFGTVYVAVGAAVSRHNGSEVRPSESPTTTPDSPSPDQRYTSCGHSPVEARARGCHFDMSSFAWVTPECYAGELAEEFMGWANWTWYLSDEAGNDTQLSYEEASRGERNTFIDWNYHIVHCTFMWRQQHWSMESGWIGRHLVHLDHTRHCQHSLLQDVYESRNIRTPARIVFPPCLKVGAEEGMYPGPDWAKVEASIMSS